MKTLIHTKLSQLYTLHGPITSAMLSPLVLDIAFDFVQLFTKHSTWSEVQDALVSRTDKSNKQSNKEKGRCRITILHYIRSYLWLSISTVPYCSIQSFPKMMLCTQHIGFVQVYASLCLEEVHTGDPVLS